MARFCRKFGLFTAFIEVSDFLSVVTRFCDLENNKSKRKAIQEKSNPREKQSKRKNYLKERAVEKENRAKG